VRLSSVTPDSASNFVIHKINELKFGEARGSALPVATRSEAWVRSRSLAGIAASNPTGNIGVFVVSYALSGTGLCDELITRLEDSY
jgi:hypothetical protein